MVAADRHYGKRTSSRSVTFGQECSPLFAVLRPGVRVFGDTPITLGRR